MKKFDLFVCLYKKNVNTAEPSSPKYLFLTHMTQGKVYVLSK